MSLGAMSNTKDNEISMIRTYISLSTNTIHSWTVSLARYRDIQKISTHVAEVSSKLIKDITNILYHNCLTYHDNK